MSAFPPRWGAWCPQHVGTSQSRFPRHVSCQSHVPRSRGSVAVSGTACTFSSWSHRHLACDVSASTVSCQTSSFRRWRSHMHDALNSICSSTRRRATVSTVFIASLLLLHSVTQLRRRYLVIYDFQRRLWFASSFDSDPKDICHVSLTSNFLLSPISTAFSKIQFLIFEHDSSQIFPSLFVEVSLVVPGNRGSDPDLKS